MGYESGGPNVGAGGRNWDRTESTQSGLESTNTRNWWWRFCAWGGRCEVLRWIRKGLWEGEWLPEGDGADGGFAGKEE